MAKLFEPITLGNQTLANRIVIAPMCMYSAEDGKMTDWHAMHLGQLAQSGAAMLTIEATAVTPDGRISYADVGLWDDATEGAIANILKSVRRWSNMPIAIQLAHAGRKASTAKPWDGAAQIAPNADNGWQTVSSSDLPFEAHEHAPIALDTEGLARIRNAFVDATHRSARLGIDAVQIHAAHGYLLHQFLSPLSNHRTDEYGGSLENRMRFPLEVFDAMRAAFPAEKAMTVRLSATDWVEGGWDVAQSIEFSKALEARGASAIHVSTGGLSIDQKIPVGPSYQVPFARQIKEAISIPVITVGLITEPAQAEAIIATGDADMIALARTVLYDPRWPWHAAAALGAKIAVAPQYLRSQPHKVKDLFVQA